MAHMFASRSQDLQPGFSLVSGDTSLDPSPRPFGRRDAYYYLVNIDEHPEVLPLADHLIQEHMGAVDDGARHLPPDLASPAADADSLGHTINSLSDWSERFARPWNQADEDRTRRQVLHYFLQYLPMALVDGCWLQCGLRVSTAHTAAGARLTGLYAHQVRAFIEDPGRHFVNDYRMVYERLGAPLEEVSSRSFAERGDVLESSFSLPSFLLAIAQFPRSYLPELLGVNLVWQYLNLSEFGPALVRDLCAAYELPPLGDDLGTREYLEQGRRLAREATAQFLSDQDDSLRDNAWSRVRRGVATGLVTWTQWFEHARAAAPQGPVDPRHEMIDLVRRKAPHAYGYHTDKTIGTRRIDSYLRPDGFDGAALLDDLARSPWVKPGESDQSVLVKGLVEFGGPMLAVFSPVELKIMRTWIDSLGHQEEATPEGSAPGTSGALHSGGTVMPAADDKVLRPVWSTADFRRRSRKRYGGCSVRDLYYHLINVEFFPDILPVAERFATDRLERARAMLYQGERPIPSRRYGPDLLERWVYTKHREQIDGYRPFDTRPEVPRDAFVESTVQLAPIILIDGGWLQGMASPALIHTTVGRMLFHVFLEEVGEGNPEEHHANIYRDLLAAMGEEAPPVDTREFAQWSRLKDSSFDIPTLWLSISCFPRHFLPEILGLNLAVELAGIGGPYMEARDTLRHLGLPTLFVDVHNAADNVSVGHAAWAMNAIKRFMDEVAEREGPHNLDSAWHRVWTGVCATLPQIGRVRLMAHRIARRLFGTTDVGRVPLIFPS